MRYVRNRTNTATIVYRDECDPVFDVGHWTIRDDEVLPLLELLRSLPVAADSATWYQAEHERRSGRLSERDPMEQQSIPSTNVLRDEAVAYVAAETSTYRAQVERVVREWAESMSSPDEYRVVTGIAEDLGISVLEP